MSNSAFQDCQTAIPIQEKEASTMLSLYLWIVNWLKREEGQDLAEYALLIGLIALVVLLAVTILGQNLSTLFSRIAAEVASWF
jgi:pilus assembly protein Flp/PilA